MAQLDSFLTRLQQQNASRINFQGDAPMQIQLPAGISEGAVLDNARVGEILSEIMPAEARAQLEELGAASFSYASPLGPCAVAASRPGGVWRVEIVPPAVTPMPQRMASPLQNVAVQDNDSGQRNAVLPPELRGFNWGGLLLSWVWALGHNTWIGLLGLIPVVGFLMRLVLGFKGNEMAWRSRKWQSVEQFRATQRVWTVAGLVITLVGGLFFLPMAAILFPVFARARENARRAACIEHLQQISMAVLMYAEDHGNKCPTGTSMVAWQTALKPYLKGETLYLCPSAKNVEESYLVNPKLAGANLETLSNRAMTPMFFDAEARHLDGVSVVFADGHTRWYRAKEFESQVLPSIQK